jgi:hypothetical protein
MDVPKELFILQFVFFCIYLSLHAVRYVANLITSKFWAPEKIQKQIKLIKYTQTVPVFHMYTICNDQIWHI